MKIKQLLLNPFALAAQGFAIGAAIFLSTAPRAADAAPADQVDRTRAAVATGQIGA